MFRYTTSSMQRWSIMCCWERTCVIGREVYKWSKWHHFDIYQTLPFHLFDSLLEVDRHHSIPDSSYIESVTRQVARLSIYYISVSFFNQPTLLFRFNLTQLEEWCRINQLHENYGVVEEQETITEIVQLLQVNKKSANDVDGIIEICNKLNSLQVSHITSTYNYSAKKLNGLAVWHSVSFGLRKWANEFMSKLM